MSLAASHAFRGMRAAALAWPLAVVALSWPFGAPNFDFNYRPSGDLAGTVAKNRRAFEVADEIGRSIAQAREATKIAVGRPAPAVFDRIDFVPAIEVAMAVRSVSVHAIGRGGWALRFRDAEGFDTKFYPLRAFPADEALEGAGLYAPWGADVEALRRRGFEVRAFRPPEMFEARGGDPDEAAFQSGRRPDD